jgi:hypothetical protein
LGGGIKGGGGGVGSTEYNNMQSYITIHAVNIYKYLSPNIAIYMFNYLTSPMCIIKVKLLQSNTLWETKIWLLLKGSIYWEILL